MKTDLLSWLKELNHDEAYDIRDAMLDDDGSRPSTFLRFLRQINGESVYLGDEPTGYSDLDLLKFPIPQRFNASPYSEYHRRRKRFPKGRSFKCRSCGIDAIDGAGRRGRGASLCDACATST